MYYMLKRKGVNMHGRSTNLLNYDVNIQEIFDNKSAIPTRIRVKAENYKHKLIKYYPVEGNFYEYMSVIIPQIKSDIVEMEGGLDV